MFQKRPSHTSLSRAELLLLTLVVVCTVGALGFIFWLSGEPDEAQAVGNHNALQGDFDGNGRIDASDLESMQLALKQPQQYADEHGRVDAKQLITLGDINQDGVFNQGDVAAFEQMLANQASISNPSENTIKSPSLANIEQPAVQPAAIAEPAPEPANILEKASEVMAETPLPSDPVEMTISPIVSNGTRPASGSSTGGSSSSGSLIVASETTGNSQGGKISFGTAGSGGSGGGGGSSLSSGSSGGGGSGGGGGGGGGGSSGGGTAATDDSSMTGTATATGGVGGEAITRDLTPAAMGLNEGPEGVTAPGSKIAPRLALTDTRYTPQISQISEVTQPGETLAITGSYLRGSTLNIWVDGMNFSISPLKADNDRMLAILPSRLIGGYGNTIAHATTLIWPVRDREEGVPIRVNGATAWWAWPGRIMSDDTAQILRVFGKNLEVESGSPILVIQGLGQSPRVLQVTEQNPYSLEATLPANLPTGKYKVWAHNGTGGAFGWSDVVWFEVVKPAAMGDGEYEVDDYVDVDHNDSAAIALAIADAKSNGGGVVKFSARVYELTEPIILPDNVPVILRGSGMGNFDPDTSVFTGPGTLLREDFDEQENYVIHMRGRGDIVEDMTISYTHSDTKFFSGINMRGLDQTISKTRVIFKGVGLSACIASAGHNKSANREIIDCDIHTQRMGIYLSNGGHYVRVNNCQLRGYYASGDGYDADAIVNMGSSQVIIENNEVRSHDRANGKVFNRTCLFYNNSIRNSYLANNQSTYMGPTPAIADMGRNLGEQYLFHIRGEIDGKKYGGGSSGGGGIYSVAAASSDTLTINGVTPDMSARHEEDWVAFVAKGKGAGQFRAITSMTGNHVELEKPWRVIPSQQSVVIIERMFRQNIIYNNTVDASPDPELKYPKYKTAGVFWYHLCFDNITASNIFSNLTQGVSIATGVGTPSAWNVTRDNQITSISGWAGDCAFKPMFYSEHNRGLTENNRMQKFRHWTSVGNVFRGNTCSGSEASAQVGWLQYRGTRDENYTPSADSGMALSIIENNRFTDVDQGILLSAPATWTMIRSNTMELKSFQAERVLLHNEERVIDAYLPGKHNISYD